MLLSCISDRAPLLYRLESPVIAAYLLLGHVQALTFVEAEKLSSYLHMKATYFGLRLVLMTLMSLPRHVVYLRQ